MTQKTCVSRHVCEFRFIVTFCDLTLTFLSMALILGSTLHRHSPALWMSLSSFQTVYLTFNCRLQWHFAILTAQGVVGGGAGDSLSRFQTKHRRA